MAKQKTQLERLQENAAAVFEGRTNLVAVDIHIVGRFLNEDGAFEEVEMGTLSAPPRFFKPDKDGLFSKGFNLSGKVNDPTEAGQLGGLKYQVGCNIIAVKSKLW